MTFIGIDPGAKGGIAVIEGTRAEAWEYSDRKLQELMAEADERVCVVENVHAMPGQGVTSMFNFGKGFGYILGVLETYGAPYELVNPKKWKREFSVTADKNSSIEVCKRLFPKVSLLATPRCRKEHDGMAEAMLMAEYCRRHFALKDFG